MSEYPEKHIINLENSSVQLTYSSKRPLQIEFDNLKKCSPEEIQLLFTDGLMKLLIEQHLQLIELKSIILAKDQEIEDYKNQGGELLRRELKVFKLIKVCLILFTSFRFQSYSTV